MLVTGVTTVSAVNPGIWNLTVTRNYNSTIASHAVGAAVKKVTYPNLTIRVANTGGTSSVQNGDTIRIDAEQMTVTGVAAAGAGLWDLTVTRGVNGTPVAFHNSGAGTTVFKPAATTTVQVA